MEAKRWTSQAAVAEPMCGLDYFYGILWKLKDWLAFLHFSLQLTWVYPIAQNLPAPCCKVHVSGSFHSWWAQVQRTSWTKMNRSYLTSSPSANTRTRVHAQTRSQHLCKVKQVSKQVSPCVDAKSSRLRMCAGCYSACCSLLGHFCIINTAPSPMMIMADATRLSQMLLFKSFSSLAQVGSQPCQMIIKRCHSQKLSGMKTNLQT